MIGWSVGWWRCHTHVLTVGAQNLVKMSTLYLFVSPQVVLCKQDQNRINQRTQMKMGWYYWNDMKRMWWEGWCLTQSSDSAWWMQRIERVEAAHHNCSCLHRVCTTTLCPHCKGVDITSSSSNCSSYHHIHMKWTISPSYWNLDTMRSVCASSIHWMGKPNETGAVLTSFKCIKPMYTSRWLA